MRGMWLFCLCVLVVALQSEISAQRPELLVIDNFETEGSWGLVCSPQCTIQGFEDRLNTREGQASLRLEAEFAASCEEEQCYAGISREAPDLIGYTFFRLWIRDDTPDEFVLGIHLNLTGDREAFHVIQHRSGWQLITISLLDFRGEGEQSLSFEPGELKSISLFMGASKAITVRINVDGFVALTDSNSNGIPDVDESDIREAAKTSEEMASQYFEEEDYLKAEKYYQEANSLYDQLGNTAKSQEMDQMAKESRAWIDFKRAEDLYQNEQYDNAMQAYERARREFVLVDNKEMIDLIEDKLEELSNLTGRPIPPLSGVPSEQTQPGDRERGGIGRLLFVLLIIVVVGVGVYLWKFRETPAEGERPEKPPKLEKPEEKMKPLLPSEQRAEEIRKLKAKFVYGEISRKDYERKLRELEEKS